ncbi:PEP-CTERM sorting domain-containing protein [Roseisolibacter sp. H3M3-2]|uniref:Npun_F0296 family exosortase-dependent surface protein n=1 Tax=Roseisolibacter sp. H3M3-2 TaxID=3031323 RepID=UPI0023DC9F3E|nr:PEP-CTERM sorting domain-containing protein [Roseisolibacter sp. H3M3-2]MDF1501439.1 PEP-CTERM sorting domain-containing protein [Roseisolibacter sp. H3M3-2]
MTTSRRRTRRTRASLATAALLAAVAAPAGAQTVYYGQNDLGTANAAVTTARSDFLAALTGVGTETFEGIPTGTGAPLALTFPGAGTATVTGTGRVATGNSSGAAPVSGSRYYLVTTGSGSEFTITFTDPIAAFGFYGRDLGDSGSNLLLRLTRVSGSIIDVQVPYDYRTDPLASGNLLFFGLIDAANPFTSVQFRSTGSGDVFGFDDMTIGTAGQVTSTVPEPSTYALLGTGLAVLGAVGRRRRRPAM